MSVQQIDRPLGEALPFPHEVAGMPIISSAEQASYRPLQTEGGVLYMPDALTPIRQQVPGLGRVALLDRHDKAGRGQADPERPDRWYRVELDGYNQGVRVTDPLPGIDSGIDVVLLEGLSETIEAGTGKALHDAFAEQAPYLRVISIETDGIGSIGDKLSREEAPDHGIHEMAEQRVKLLKALCGDRPIVLVGKSMGTVIGNLILNYDLHQGHNLQVVPVNYVPAIVTPDKTGLFMKGLFVPAMGVDVARELLGMVFKRHNPHQALDVLKILKVDHPSHLPALAVQIEGLLKGTEFAQFESVTAAYSGVSIAGALDPLSQPAMHRYVQTLHPHYSYERVSWRGHGMAADSQRAAREIISTLQLRHIFDDLLAA